MTAAPAQPRTPKGRPRTAAARVKKPEAESWLPLRYQRQAGTLKRDAVLSVAAAAFCENGYHATSLDDIAERLHMTKSTLYYYFKSKDEILYRCMHRGLSNVRAAVNELFTVSGSGRDVLQAIMERCAEQSLNVFSRCATLIGEGPLPEARRKELLGLEREIWVKIRSVVQRGMDDGSIARADPRIVTSNLSGALTWITRWFDPGGPLSAQEVSRMSIDSLMHGIIPRAETSDQAKNPAKKPAKGRRR